jgi:hypothetical protein
MQSKVPFVAFSLQPDDDALHTTSLDRGRLSRNLLVEDSLATLGMLNERGLEAAATMIGKYVLGMLYMSNREKFAEYPNLIVKTGPGPTPEEIQRMTEKLDRDDVE